MLSVYHFPALYRWLMRLGYGADYAARLALVAEHVGAPGSVLEVCCGDLALHDRLERRGLLTEYVGIEHASALVRRGRRHGVDVRERDVRAAGALPTADTVIMQASLYQFHDVAEMVLGRLWAAARQRLIVAEPVRNLAQSRSPLARALARALTRTVDGRTHAFRYTESELRALYARCGIPISRLDLTPGGREVVVSSLKPPAETASPMSTARRPR